MKNTNYLDSPIITVRNVSLCYRLQSNIFSKLDKCIWPLKNVSFDVYRGKRIGIIGKNGCGKSTLLKMLGGIFAPDAGEVIVMKNIHVHLLSLGVGMEGNLSGKDNAVLNGMFLGKSRSYMINLLEEIKEFSELGKFFDYPVNTYSSGMLARLSFSIAIQVDPDVLLLDEILSVGDADFQKKSSVELKKKITSRGTSTVLVSHSSQDIRSFCDHVIWLENGIVKASGDADSVTQAYEKSLERIIDDPPIHQDALVHA